MESFVALIRALCGGDPRDWSLPPVTSLLGRAGLVVEPTATGRFEVRPAPRDLRVDIVADPDVDAPHAAGAVYGVGLTPTGVDFATAVGAARDVLGPPPTVGGPGPWVRWPNPTIWWTLARSPTTAGVRLFAEPADRAALDERRDMEFSTLGALPYLWRIDSEPLLPFGTWLPTARAAKTLDTLEAQLTAVCASLADARRHLPEEVPGATVVVRSRRGRHEIRCRVDAAGWSVQVDGVGTEHPASDVGAHAAAGTVLRAIRDWGEPAKQLREVSISSSGRLSLPGLGLARGRE